MVSKGDLGVAYFITVGAVLVATLGTGVTVPHVTSGALAVSAPLPVGSGLAIGTVFGTTGLWLRRHDLAEGIAWPVAIWASAGLAVATLVLVVLSIANPPALAARDWRTLSSLNIAFGGLVGILSGALIGLRSEYETKETLYQRNTVFLRLFRHDIRNSINVVRGHVNALATEADGGDDSVGVIEDHLAHILRLGEAARNLDRLDEMGPSETIDLAGLVRERIEAVRADEADVTVEADLTESVCVEGTDLLAIAVDNVLTNAVEHLDGDGHVTVALESPVERPRTVELTVRDDGPGFPEDELAVHTGADETPLQHSDGVGLWVTRWIVEAHQGTFAIANLADGGAKVRIALPAASADC